MGQPTDHLRTVHRSAIEAVVMRRPLAPWLAYFAPHHRFQQGLVPDVPDGAAGLEHLAHAYRAAFTVGHVQVEAQVAQGDRVYTRVVTQVRNAGRLGRVCLPTQWMQARLLVLSRVTDDRFAHTFIESNAFETVVYHQALVLEPDARTRGPLFAGAAREV